MIKGYLVRSTFINNIAAINNTDLILAKTEEEVKAIVFSSTKYTKYLLDGYAVDFYECRLIDDMICARNTKFDTLKYYSDSGIAQGVYISLTENFPAEFTQELTKLIQKYIPTWTLNRK